MIAEAAPGCAVLAQPVLRNVVSPGTAAAAPRASPATPGSVPLAANGGPTPTLLPGAGSAAIDAIVGAPCPGTDQRGLPRPGWAAATRAPSRCSRASRRRGDGQGRPGAGGAPPPDPAAERPCASPRPRSGSRARAPLGATLSFTLSAGGRVVITVRRRCRAAGRVAAASRWDPGSGRPAAASAGSRSRAACCAWAPSGKNTIHFGGTLRGKALPAGRYTLVVTLPGRAPPRPWRRETGFTILG